MDSKPAPLPDLANAIEALLFAQNTIGDGPGAESITYALAAARAGQLAEAARWAARAEAITGDEDLRGPGGARIPGPIGRAIRALWAAQTSAR